MKLARAAVVSLATLLAAVAVAVATAGAQGTPPYLDPKLSPEERADDLLSRMSLREKVGQMTQINATVLQGDPANDWDRGPLNEQKLAEVLDQNQAGSILSGGGASPAVNSPRAWAEMVNDIQRLAIDHQEHGIPIVYGIDAVHGHNNVLGATMFPHQIGTGASFEPRNAYRIGAATAADVRATGIPWNFAPVADVWRDLRWGRSYEPYSESPLVAADMVEANVYGQEGRDPSKPDKVAATVKHFLGYSAPDSGRDRENATISEEDLREIHLPSFERGIDAGAETIMVNSGSVNGVPVHASRELLTGLLRDELGFEGVAVSDWEDIIKLVTVHGVAATYEDAIEMAIEAGVDMSMVPLDATGFTTRLIALVESGRVPQARIDEAVHRILTLKFELGLFERPYADPDDAERIVGRHTELARDVAADSMTLLENDGTLPLRRRGADVLVIGPSADSIVNQLGGWSIGWQGATVPGEVPEGVTVREGIEQAVGGRGTVRFAEGDEAVAEAEDADVVVAVVGEPPYAEGPGDTTTAALPDGQAEQLDALIATGTPVVIVTIAGRPLMMNEQLDGAAAALMAYLPGTEGGTAVADVLFGEVNPSARLPFTWPRSIDQAPLTHDRSDPYDPRYPFGHGLSYTRWEIGHVRKQTHRGKVTLSLKLRNEGRRSGERTVLVFAGRELVAYDKEWVKAGRSEGMRFRFEAEKGERIRIR